MAPPKFEIISGASLGEPNLYAVSTEENRVLLDAGAPYSGSADVCFVSHAHLDHAIEVEKHLRNMPVMMSKDTKDSLHQNGIQTDTATLFKFHTKYEFGDISLTPLPSGHLQGAAMFLIEAQGKTLLYTSDFCLHPIADIEGIDFPDQSIDLLVCESSLANLRIEEDDLSKNEEKLRQLGAKTGPTLIICRRIGDLDRVKALLPDFLRHENCDADRKGIRHSDALDYLNTEAKLIVAGNLSKSSASNLLVAKLLSNPAAQIVLINGVQRTKEGIGLQKFARRSRIKWGSYQGRLRAHVHSVSLRNHPTRKEVIEFTNSIAPKKVTIIHGPDSGRYAIAKKIRKLGYEVLVPTSGDKIEI